MPPTIARLGLWIAVLPLASVIALGADLTPEDCVHVYRQRLGACAVNACTRAVRGGLPLPRTVSVVSSNATFSDTGTEPVSIRVTGRVTFQVDSGPFHETEFSCTVEANMVMNFVIAKPNLAVNTDAPRAGLRLRSASPVTSVR
jgi:hypothetical protein